MDLASLSSGERVRALRKANGMTLTDLADAVDVSVSMLNRIELGRRPLGELAVSIAAALGVSERDLTAPPDERVPGEVREAYCDQLLTRLSREDDVSIVRGTTLDAYVPLYFAVRRGAEPARESLVYARTSRGCLIARRIADTVVRRGGDYVISSDVMLMPFAIVRTGKEIGIPQDIPRNLVYASDDDVEQFGVVVYVSADHDAPDGYSIV